MDYPPATAVMLVVYADRMTYHTLSYLSLKDLAVHMIVSAVLPSLNSSTIDMRRKGKLLIARWTDLNTVTVAERDREIN